MEDLKKRYPNFKVTCFVIAKDLNTKLVNWLQQDWIEVGVHGYDHDSPPECERDDKEKRIELALNILKPLLLKKFGFRAPGFQMTATTYPILNKLGFWYIAHQTRIQPLKDIKFIQDEIINTHIYEELNEKNYELANEQFKFIFEGFNNNASKIQT